MKEADEEESLIDCGENLGWLQTVLMRAATSLSLVDELAGS